MARLIAEDEALIQRFIGLHTGDSSGSSLTVPTGATTTIDWKLSLLAKVISDRTAIESQFQVAMMKAWNADPNTVVSSISKNCFLIQFQDQQDLNTAQFGGPWTFKGDLVAFKPVSSHKELKQGEVRYAHLWVQLFHILPNAFNEEGLLLLGKEVGVPASLPVEGYVGGKRFIKMKIRVDLTEPLKDKFKVNHPVLGELVLHCVYEKVNRICVFCSNLGHEMVQCPDHSKLTILMQTPEGLAQAKAQNILAPTRGPWMCNPTLIPKESQQEGKGGLKRGFNQHKPKWSSSSGQAERSPQGLTFGPIQISDTLEGTATQRSPSSPVKNKKAKSAGHNPLAQII